MNTLILDQTLWDLCLDTSGNIALASDPYSIAQDVASAIKTFQGEAWYNTALGLPYFGQILGEQPPMQFIEAQMVAAALEVPEVATAVCYLTDNSSRVVTGQIQIVDTSGAVQIVGF